AARRPYSGQRGVLLEAVLGPLGEEDLLGPGGRRARRGGWHDRCAARQTARYRRRENARRYRERPTGEDPLPGDRPRRQPRRVGGAAAAHRPRSEEHTSELQSREN